MPRCAVHGLQPLREGTPSVAAENDANRHQNGRDENNDDEGALAHGAKTIEGSLNGP